MTENEITYLAFLSYSQQDNDEQRPDAPHTGSLGWVDWLHKALKNFPIPAEFVGQVNARAEIIPEQIDAIFLDQEEQSGNASLSEGVRKALEQSKCLIVICSPRSAKSLHVNAAVGYFKQLGRGNRILPIVIAGEPNATDGHKPGIPPDDECFVPALRHPVKPDGTLDLSRRDRGSIYADARHGDAKQEISVSNELTGESKLEAAKIQLIAGLIGVGFNGLWERELKRRFIEAKILARAQPPDSRNPVPELQNEVLAAQNQTRVAQQQIQEFRNQAEAAQSKVLAAQQQAQEALGQVAEARKQAQAAEGRVLEAQAQLEEARHQVREAQSKFLEIQNLPQDVKSQLQEAQSKVQEAQEQARNAQSQAEAAGNEARETQHKFLEAQNQVRVAQSQIQEIENQARQTQSQLAEARNQAQAAETKILEAQQQARTAQQQVEEARRAQDKILEIQIQTRDAQNQARTAQNQVQEIQNKSQAARRLTKIFAIMAALALMAAGLATHSALRQRKLASQVLAKPASVEVREDELASGPLTRERIQQALQQFGGAGQNEPPLRRLDELVNRIPAEEISGTLDAAAAILNDPQRSHFQEQLLDYWVKTNAPAAFDWSCQLTNVDSQQRALEKIIPALAAGNLTNALARLNNLKPAPSERIYMQLFQRWAANNPIQAIEQRRQIPGQDVEAKILSAILIVWSAQQPEAALEWLAAQPDSELIPAGTWRNAMIADLFDAWAAKDLEAATTACQQLPDRMAKEKAWEYVLSRRIVKAPVSAAELVKNLPLGDYRQKAMVELCNHWVGTNAPTILDWAQSLPSEAERFTVTNRFISNWAQSDPPAASQFADQHPELCGIVFSEIANAWFQRDFTAATNWIASLPEGEKKDSARLAVVETWAQNDPKGMVAYALGLPPGDVQTRYLSAAGRRLASRDFPATVESLQPLSDAALRQTILEQAARNCDLPHMNQAAKFIAAMSPGDDQEAAIKGLISSWAPVEPETAANWMISFPETNSRPEQVQSVIKLWAQPEPAIVANWLANLPAGTASEGMINAFLDGAVVKYPDYAALWTQSVTDETKRQKYQARVARQWMKTDLSSATRWIDGLSLPEEIKQSLKAR